MVFGLPASRRRRIEHAKTRTPEKAATKYAGRKDKAIRNGKRGAAVFSGRMRKVGCKELRYKVIHRFRDRFTVEELCKLLEVSRSGYYKWLKRKDEPDKDKVIADLIVECHEKAHRTYGYRRVKMWLLRETGLVINHKAVLRIMRKYNLLAIRKRKRFRHYDCNTYTHYNNELMRNFKATRPNEMEMSRNVQSGNTQNLKSSAAPVRLPAAPAPTPGTSRVAVPAGCVYRP